MVIAMSVGACAGRPRERARRPSGNRSRYPPLLRSAPGPAASCRGTRWTPRVFLLYGTNAAHRLHRAVRGDREDPPASWLVTDARPKPLGSPVPPVGLRPIESSSSGGSALQSQGGTGGNRTKYRSGSDRSDGGRRIIRAALSQRGKDGKSAIRPRVGSCGRFLSNQGASPGQERRPTLQPGDGRGLPHSRGKPVENTGRLV